MQELFRAIPSMDICLKAIKDENADLARLPQNLLKDLVTDFWNMIRVLIREKKITDASSLAIENQLGECLARQGAEKHRAEHPEEDNKPPIYVKVNEG